MGTHISRSGLIGYVLARIFMRYFDPAFDPDSVTGAVYPAINRIPDDKPGKHRKYDPSPEKWGISWLGKYRLLL